MKKQATIITTVSIFNTLKAKLFLFVLLFCCNSFQGFATAWTTATAGAINNLSNWTDGTTSPTDFTIPGDTWTVTKAMTMPVGVGATVTWILGTVSMPPVTLTFATGGGLTGGSTGTTININVYGDCIINSGTISISGTSASFNMNVHGNYTMTGGRLDGNGTVFGTVLNVYGNFSMSGASRITASGTNSTSNVHLRLPSGSGTMLADNTSTGAWTITNVFIDAGCTAQLDGDFSTTTGTATYGLTVNGRLFCPAAYVVNGAGILNVKSGATLKVAHPGGIDDAIITTGTKTFSTGANYAFNGSVAQVTGTYLPASLVSPDTITISNSAGVTLTQSTLTTGKLLFTSGILHTGANTMSTPGAATGVVGAGATSYVDGTLIKTISGLSTVNYEVGNTDYVPMNLAFSGAGTGGSIGIKATAGLHPNVGSSGFFTTNIVNDYWTITNISAAGPATVIPTGTYNFSDIIGGTNSTFKTQEYTSGAWLVTPLATTNTATPYTSVPNAGITLATLAGDYIFGSNCSTPVITGTPSACAGGATTTLSDATGGGTWSSSNTAVATVDPATGVVSGVSAGTTVILYTLSCPATILFTVGTLPITGVTNLCPSSTTALSDATAGGTWSSGNTGVATVSSTGVVYGTGAGSTNIFYTFGSCTAVSTSVTVAALGPITGSTSTCSGTTITLSDATTGGVWSSSSTAIATVDPSTGVVSGVSAGTSTIAYTLGSCSMSVTVTVTGALVPIKGASTVCVGSTTALSEATTGGVWSSSNTGVATVSGTGVVGGVSGGADTIYYTAGSCSVSYTITVSGALVPITGTTTLCVGTTTSLSEATTGGVWSSDNTAIATVDPLGVVGGVSAGIANISYTAGSCSMTVSVTVGTLPISAPSNLCTGTTVTFSDGTPGGVWSSDNTGVATVSATGDVTGVTPGTANISYTLGSCAAVSVSVTVVTLAPITPSTSITVCTGGTTALSDATAGGVWSSGNTAVATVSTTGVVSGVSSGTAIISYTIGSCSMLDTVTGGGTLPAITGVTNVCINSSTALSDATAGGTWSSGSTAIATVSGIGVVWGVSAGTATITYSTGSCSVTVLVTVGSLPAITGGTSVCVGGTLALADATTGGTWSSGSVTAATVDPVTGVVSGVVSGSATIYYTVGACTVSVLVTVGSPISAITGVSTLCAGSTTTLNDATPSGTWSSGTTAVATVSGTGVVSGVAAGSSTISYTVGGCSVTLLVTVLPSNAGTITGKDSLCIGGAHVITLSDNVGGGVWSSSSTARATVDPVTGVVSGVSTGVDTIKYTVTNSCGTFVAKFVIHIRTAAQCATGINGTQEQITELKVFPNPNKGVFTVNLQSAEADEVVHVVITNIVGEKVREFTTTTNKAVEIKLSPAAGIYLLSASTANGRYNVKIVVD